MKKWTTIAWLPQAIAQAISTGDLDWLEKLHALERKYDLKRKN
jgi:hypothetical protein